MVFGKNNKMEQPNFANLKPVGDQPNFGTLKPGVFQSVKNNTLTQAPNSVNQSFMQKIAYKPMDVGNETGIGATFGKTAANQAGSVYNLGLGVANFLNPVENANKIGQAIGSGVLYNRDLAAQGQSQQAVKDYIPRLQEAIAKNKATGKDTSNLERLLKEAGGQTVDNGHQELAKALPNALYQSLTPATVQQGVEAGKTGGFSEGFHAAVQSIAEDPQQLAPYFLMSKKFIETKLPTVDNAISKVGGVPGDLVDIGVEAVKAPVKNALETKYVNDLYNKYNEVFTQTKTAKKTFDKSTATGKDPASFGAQNGYVVDVQKGKINSQPTISQVSEEYIKPRATILDDMLKAKDKTISPNQYTPLDVIAEQAKKGIEKNPLAKGSGTLSDQQLAVDKIISELKAQYGEKISDYDLNQIKKAQWAESSSFDLTKPKFMGDVNYQIGNAIKNIIEKNNPELTIKKLNAEIGNAADFVRNLKKVDGQTSPGGGKMTKLFGRTVGAIAGSGAGPFGSIGGAMVGNYITELLQNNSIAGPLKRSILENIAPDSSLYAEAQLALHRLQNTPGYAELGQTTQQTVKPSDLGQQPMSPLIKVNDYRSKFAKFLTPDQINKITEVLNAKQQVGKPLDMTMVKIAPTTPKTTPETAITPKVGNMVQPKIRTVDAFKGKNGSYLEATFGEGTYTGKTKAEIAQRILDTLPNQRRVSIETPAMTNAENWAKSVLNKKLDPLAQEATKYKSAEEFVKAQPTYYHGSPNADALQKGGFDLSKAGSTSGYKGVYGRGVYLTNDVSRANLYGKSMDIVIDPKAKLLQVDAKNALDTLFIAETKYGEPDLIRKMVMDKGYDGVRIINNETRPSNFTGKTIKAGAEEIAIFNPDIIKTKSQLTEIWNKANKKDLPKK